MITRLGQGLDDSLCVQKSHFILVMSLLNVPSTPFPPVFSPSTATPTPLTGIRLNPCATPLWGGPSGHLSDPTPNTGHEPKFCIDVSSEHTPINLPTRNMTFQLEQRLYEAEADVDVKHWEKRNSEIALYEVNQEYESRRFQLQQANRWADHAQRDTPSLCRELEVRNRLFQESQAKDCQEIQELRRMCREETDRARQAIIDELSMQQERNPTTVSP